MVTTDATGVLKGMRGLHGRFDAYCNAWRGLKCLMMVTATVLLITQGHRSHTNMKRARQEYSNNITSRKYR